MLCVAAWYICCYRSGMTASSWCVSSCVKRRSCRRSNQQQNNPSRYLLSSVRWKGLCHHAVHFSSKGLWLLDSTTVGFQCQPWVCLHSPTQDTMAKASHGIMHVLLSTMQCMALPQAEAQLVAWFKPHGMQSHLCHTVGCVIHDQTSACEILLLRLDLLLTVIKVTVVIKCWVPLGICGMSRLCTCDAFHTSIQ